MSISIYRIEEIVSSGMLERAKVYLDQEMVQSIERLGDHDFNAVVKGSVSYAVNIVLDKDKNLFTHRCDCPYNASPICKHKLTVILYLRRQLEKGEIVGTGLLSQINRKLLAYNREELQQLIIDITKGSVKSRREVAMLLELKID